MKNCKKYLKKHGWILHVDKVDNSLYVITIGKDKNLYYAHHDKRRIARKIRNYTRQCAEFQELTKFVRERYGL